MNLILMLFKNLTNEFYFSSPLQAELEDLSFAVLYPSEHRRVANLVSSRQDPAALEATIQAIKAGLEQRGIKYEDISGRPKNLYGIWQKMLKDGVSDVDKVEKRNDPRK